MYVNEIRLQWNTNLPIFAKESFLNSVSNEYGWFGGYDSQDQLQCVLPYTIIKKWGVRLVRFRVETIKINEEVDINNEKIFLNNCITLLRKKKADIIIPATTNTIFHTYPDKADAAPFGSYIIHLNP